MNHIKVYKSDIDDREKARLITRDIQKKFESYKVNIDLEDCDKVLRVESLNGSIDESALEGIFKRYGHHIEPLPFN